MCELNCARLVILILHMIADGFCKARNVGLEWFSFCLVSLLPHALPLLPGGTKGAWERVPSCTRAGGNRCALMTGCRHITHMVLG